MFLVSCNSQNKQNLITVDTRPGAQGNQFLNPAKVTGVLANQNNALTLENQSLRTIVGHITKVVTLLTEETVKNSKELKKSKEVLPKKKRTRPGGFLRKIRKAKGEKRVVTKLTTHGQIDIVLCQSFLQDQSNKKNQQEVSSNLRDKANTELRDRQAKEYKRILQIAKHKRQISKQPKSAHIRLLEAVDQEVITKYRTEAWVYNRNTSIREFRKRRAKLLVQEIHKVEEYSPLEKDNWLVWAKQHKYISSEQCEYQRKKLVWNLDADIQKCRRELNDLELDVKVEFSYFRL